MSKPIDGRAQGTRRVSGRRTAMLIHGRVKPVVLLVLAGVVSGALGTVLVLTLYPSARDVPPAAAARDGRDTVAEVSAGASDSRSDVHPRTTGQQSEELLVTGQESDPLTLAARERAQLANEVLRLQRQLADVERRLQVLDAAVLAVDRESGEGSVASATSVQPSTDGVEELEGRPRRGDLDSLLAAGLDEPTALSLQARRDRFQLARLELLDEAAREGWSESSEFEQRLEALQQDAPDLRQELGDDAYDHYLHAQGRRNRVMIASVIPGSAAELAGLIEGDLIQRYDDSRIFTAGELQQATRSGSRDDVVTVSVDRDGQIMTTQLPRGPLGVNLRAVSREP